MADFVVSPLSSARLCLEPVGVHHAVPMFAGLADPEAYRFIPDDPPVSVDVLTERYRLLSGGVSPNGKELWLNWMLRLRVPADYVGFVQATVLRETLEASIAYQLFLPFWRQGYGREAVAVMLDYLRERLKVSDISAFIDTRNTASQRLAEAVGFRQAALVRNADVFKGMPSDEFDYRYNPTAAANNL